MRFDELFGGAYKPADTDEETTTQYFGFTDRDGNWYILKMIPVATKSSSFRYIRGSNNSSYATAWTNRESLSYDYFHVSFKLGGSQG